MLYEEVKDADFVVLDFGELLCDVVGYEIGAAGLWWKSESLLKPRHS